MDSAFEIVCSIQLVLIVVQLGLLHSTIASASSRIVKSIEDHGDIIKRKSF